MVGRAPMTECLVAEVTLYGWRLLDPGLVVCSLIALTLGVVCGLALLSSPSPIASLPFFGFAVMMSEAAGSRAKAFFPSAPPYGPIPK